MASSTDIATKPSSINDGITISTSSVTTEMKLQLADNTFIISRDKYSFDAKDLPEETMYIFDGTAMLHLSYYSKETSSDHKHKLLSDLITTRILSGHVDTNRDGTIVATTATIPESTATSATTISCGTLITMLNNFARIIRDVKPRYVSLYAW